jgi:hypothetical protein
MHARALFFFGFSMLMLRTAAYADSEVWTFRPNFIYDPWNTPILPYVATVPSGMSIEPKNIRAQVKTSDLAVLRNQANGDRVVRTALINKLETAADVTKAKAFLLEDNNSLQVAAFEAAASYFDKFGLLAIMHLIAKFECRVNENCPDATQQQLEIVLATGGRFMKREVFQEIRGEPWIIATVSYEVPVGSQVRVIPLRSRKLQIAAVR